MARVIGVDLGGTKTSAALVDEDGTLGRIVTAPTPARDGGTTVLDVVAALVAELLADDVAGVGVGTAGVVDSREGLIISSTDTFHDWVGTNVAAGLRERLGWDDGCLISVLNDVDAHAVGEWRFGCARSFDSILMVAVGTGVGGAVVLPDGLRTGAHQVAGEMGHVPTPGAEGLVCPCGRSGHLEALSAGPAMERRYAALTGEDVPGPKLMRRAEAGDPVALRVVEDAATGLGRAIAGIVTVLDPAAVIVGGGVADAGDRWWSPLRAALRAELVPVLREIPVLRAELGPAAALVGSAAHVFERMRKQ